MQLRFQEYDGFLAFSKPFGVRTHKVSANQLGFVEYLSEKLKKDLFVVHRLDKETSGLILFATSSEKAAELAKLFEEHKIKKTYFFLTDNKISQQNLKIKSHIEKQSEFFINNDSLPDNSETDFEFVKAYDNYYLWKALPKTGKPHQIRLHAQKAGIPILGDNQHGGSIFPRLALHAFSVEFELDKKYYVTSKEPELNHILDSLLDSRSELYDIKLKSESFRLTHNEISQVRADIFNDRLWVYDYTDQGLDKSEQNDFELFCKKHGLKLLIRRMLNRGEGVGGLENTTLIGEDLENWTATEEGVHYQMRTDSGFSPGLFLDQRENRLWAKAYSSNKDVLNLFAYTSGFSINAALGKAKTVTTVDVSKKFLDWSKENFKLNELNPENYEFYAQDTMVFLKGSIKRNRKWDLIICDPPSFGRAKDSVWKLDSQLPELGQQLVSCLNKNGKILFTCNLEKLTRDEIIKRFTKNIKNTKLNIDAIPQISLDFEVTDDQKNLMKGFILTKH